jgi:hypothetical protein
MTNDSSTNLAIGAADVAIGDLCGLGRAITASKSEIPKKKELPSVASEDPQNSAVQQTVRWYDSNRLLDNSLTLGPSWNANCEHHARSLEDLAARSGKPL